MPARRPETVSPSSSPTLELERAAGMHKPGRVWPTLIGLWAAFALLLAWNVAVVDLNTRGDFCGTPLAVAGALWFLVAASGASVAALTSVVDTVRRRRLHGVWRPRRVYVVETIVFIASALIPLVTSWWL
ncbi:MAG: hypothetical protein H6713_24240 [Myxococcales bacterium]|nr:hypothetical protein [Myxococcales bacterium]